MTPSPLIAELADRSLVRGGPSDEALVDRIRAGEHALFEILMRRHNQRVYRALRSVLRDEAEIEDAMQQAYLQAWAQLDRFQGTARFSTWLLRIAINEGLMRLRRNRRLELVPEPMETSNRETPVPSAQVMAENKELLGLLSRVVDELPEAYRLVFVLREVEELSTAETAETLAQSEDVVKTRLHRARAMIRDAVLEQLGPQSRELFTFGNARCDRVVEGVLRKINGG